MPRIFNPAEASRRVQSLVVRVSVNRYDVSDGSIWVDLKLAFWSSTTGSLITSKEWLITIADMIIFKICRQWKSEYVNKTFRMR